MVDCQSPSPLHQGKKEVGAVIAPSPWRTKRGRALSWHGGVELTDLVGGGGEVEGIWQAVADQLQKSVSIASVHLTLGVTHNYCDRENLYVCCVCACVCVCAFVCELCVKL